MRHPGRIHYAKLDNSPRSIEMVGKRFGKWVVLEKGAFGSHTIDTKWLCRCDCGTVRLVAGKTLRYGSSQSCGCTMKEFIATVNKSHGKSKTKTYKTWAAMIRRCHKFSNPDYKFYGGRGITVCDEWRHSFERFLADMGEKPEGKEIDRINNAEGYYPGNCRWVTHIENCHNFRRNRVIEFNGRKQHLKAWAIEIGLNESSLRNRLNSWSIEKALTTPANASRGEGATNGNLKRYHREELL